MFVAAFCRYTGLIVYCDYVQSIDINKCTVFFYIFTICLLCAVFFPRCMECRRGLAMRMAWVQRGYAPT